MRMLIYSILTIAFFAIITYCYMSLPMFGRAASGDRLARIERSPNYRDGKFHNQEITEQITGDVSRSKLMYDFFFEERVNNRPNNSITAVKSDLHNLNIDEDIVVWFGHSSYFIQSSGKRFLVDPVFDQASPISLFNKPFKGTEIYQAEDMPNIDILFISHDHWDHLDYETVSKLRERVTKVVCPLGVGEHFERWGYSEDQIVEMDWNESITPIESVNIHCLPSRHFSGRTFKSNQTLWASFMIEGKNKNIYLSGDGGYGKHFAEIAKRFPDIDIAIMENGQYNKSWSQIHLMPEDLVKAINELNPKMVFAGHNSKYALAKHSWYEPLNNVEEIESVVMPMIGEIFQLDQQKEKSERWW